MSKSNDTSKLDRAPQVRELRDDELQEVSGGRITMEDIIVTSFSGGLGNNTLDTGAGLRRFTN